MTTEPSDIVESLDDHIASYEALCEALGIDPLGYDSAHAQALATAEIERLRKTIDVLRDALIGIEHIVRNPDTINALIK